MGFVRGLRVLDSFGAKVSLGLRVFGYEGAGAGVNMTALRVVGSFSGRRGILTSSNFLCLTGSILFRFSL